MAQAELLAVPRPSLAPQPALAWTVDIRVISVVDLDSGYVIDDNRQCFHNHGEGLLLVESAY